ncbi:MAG: hypothetical protein V1652_03560 [bacterium]
MENNIEKLNQFFEQVKILTFWKRIFGWSQFRTLSYEAYQEFKLLLSNSNQTFQNAGEAKHDILILKNDNDHLRTIQKEQGIELSTVKERISHLEQENSLLKRENIIFKQTEDSRRKEYESKASTLNSIEEQIRNDRQKEINERQQKEIDRLTQLKETWAKHQEKVQETIKGICQKHTIDYVDKVPFKGSPDNTIKICDEFVIFDAKSPSSDDLDNFPTYIKQQTESVRKYIKEENVKKDIFLVIPSNTVNVIEQFSFNMADYNAFVITLDAIEPIILSLKKLEGYEFIDQLSPDDRDNIYRVIGRFAHVTKRRIQIDQFLGRESLEILSKCDSDLPHEVLEKVIEYERSEKLNPPQEKRAKSISIKELDVDSRKIKKEAEAKEIASPSYIQIGT